MPGALAPCTGLSYIVQSVDWAPAVAPVFQPLPEKRSLGESCWLPTVAAVGVLRDAHAPDEDRVLGAAEQVGEFGHRTARQAGGGFEVAAHLPFERRRAGVS